MIYALVIRCSSPCSVQFGGTTCCSPSWLIIEPCPRFISFRSSRRHNIANMHLRFGHLSEVCTGTWPWNVPMLYVLQRPRHSGCSHRLWIAILVDTYFYIDFRVPHGAVSPERYVVSSRAESKTKDGQRGGTSRHLKPALAAKSAQAQKQC